MSTYWDDDDNTLIGKKFYPPPDGMVFAARKATYDLGQFVPARDDNTLDWRLLIKARDWAWEQNQGLKASWLPVASDWFNNNAARPGMAGPFPNPPVAFVAVTKWVDKVGADGTRELDGNGNPVRMLEDFDVIQRGPDLVAPIPFHG